MPKDPTSLFVVIEGVDFAGKTTLLKNLKIFLEKDIEIKKYFQEIIYSREPAGEPIDLCKTIRNICLGNEFKLSNKTSALFFFASRSHHIENLIEPALKKQKNLVICDRFFLSTLVYQGNDDIETIDWIKKTQKFVTKIIPDITFLIQISYETFLSNMKQRSSEKKTYLDEHVNNFFTEMSNKYEVAIKENPEISKKTIILDGNNGIIPLVEIVKSEILKQVKN